MEMLSHNITVEPLEIDNLHWFVEVAAKNMLFDELKRPELYNRDNLFLLATQAMNSGTAFVAKAGGRCVGALGSILVPNLFNPELFTLAELVIYVLPEYRKEGVGMMLIASFDKLGDELEVEKTLSLLPMSQIGVENLSEMGYILEEYGFRKKVNNGCY